MQKIPGRSRWYFFILRRRKEAMSIEQYDAMTHQADRLLLEAEAHARTDSRRFTDDEVFGQIKERIDGHR